MANTTEELLTRFSTITGASKEEAAGFLEVSLCNAILYSNFICRPAVGLLMMQLTCSSRAGAFQQLLVLQKGP